MLPVAVVPELLLPVFVFIPPWLVVDDDELLDDCVEVDGNEELVPGLVVLIDGLLVEELVPVLELEVELELELVLELDELELSDDCVSGSLHAAIPSISDIATAVI